VSCSIEEDHMVSEKKTKKRKVSKERALGQRKASREGA
jgi:hypothetical protein